MSERMRLIPETVENWLPQERLPRTALKVVIVGVYLKLVLLPFFLLAVLLTR
jgi:hypothetical protein